MCYKFDSKSNGMVALIRSQVRFISSFRNIFYFYFAYMPPPPPRYNPPPPVYKPTKNPL